jgi:hypothetical protein
VCSRMVIVYLLCSVLVAQEVASFVYCYDGLRYLDDGSFV